MGLGYIWLSLYVLFVSCAIAILAKKRIAQAMPITVFTSIVILYLIGLFVGYITVGVVVCYVIGIGSFGFCIFSSIKNWKNVRAIISKDLILIGVLLLWSFAISYGRVFLGIDEFSHWGLVIKNIFILDHFPTLVDSNIIFSGYPPAMALWQNFACHMSGHMDEGIVYFSTCILLGSCILGMIGTSKIYIGNVKKSICAFVLFLMVPLVFSITTYSSITVDPILGIGFAYILILGFKSDKYITDKIAIFMALTTLSLIKATGLFLGVVAIVLMLVTEISNKKLTKWSVAEYVGYIFGAVLIGKVSWEIHIKLAEVNEAWNMSGLTMNSFIELIQGNAPQYRYEAIGVFFRGLWTVPVIESLRINYIILLLIWIILSVVAIRISEQSKRKNLKIYTIGISVGMIIFTISLLVLYLFTFSPGEAVNLASFGRYLKTFFVAMYFFVLYQLFEIVSCKITGKVVTRIMSFAAGVVLLISIGLYRWAPFELLNIQSRQAYRDRFAAVEENVNTYSKDEATDGFDMPDWRDALVINYIYTPR